MNLTCLTWLGTKLSKQGLQVTCLLRTLARVDPVARNVLKSSAGISYSAVIAFMYSIGSSSDTSMRFACD